MPGREGRGRHALPRLSAFALLLAVAGCAPADEATQALARAAQECLEQTPSSGPTRVRVVLAEDGSVAMTEVSGTGGGQAVHDAQMAAMRAIQACEPYDVGRAGEFDIVIGK